MIKSHKMSLAVLCIFVTLFSTACAKAPKQEEDTEWVFNSIHTYNQDRVKQFSKTIITETAAGTYEKTQILISDSNNDIVYMNCVQKGPGNYHLYTRDYMMLKDGKGYDIYKYDTQETFYKTEINTDFINNAFNSMYIILSDKAEAKILGNETVDGTDAVKVLVTDRDFPRIQNSSDFSKLYAQAVVSDVYQEELKAAHDNYMNMKEKEWTFWFSKEDSRLLKMEYDNTLDTTFTYYTLAAANQGICAEKNVPSKEIVTGYIKSGNDCDKIEVPLEYQTL